LVGEVHGELLDLGRYFGADGADGADGDGGGAPVALPALRAMCFRHAAGGAPPAERELLDACCRDGSDDLAACGPVADSLPLNRGVQQCEELFSRQDVKEAIVPEGGAAGGVKLRAWRRVTQLLLCPAMRPEAQGDVALHA
jgi:hypothetical protein